MARNKPYTRKLLVIDSALTLLTGGAWLFVVAFREVWQRI